MLKKFMLLILPSISAFLLVTGVLLQIQLSTFLGICLITLNIAVSIFCAEKIRQSWLIFILVISSLTIALSYEGISYYPLGQDVHAEYHTVKNSLHTNHIEFSRQRQEVLSPPFYYEIFSFILSTLILNYATGMNEIIIIKFIWNTLVLGLIPLIVYLYSKRVSGNKAVALIGSILIMVQSTYIVTLHSTSKQTSGLFIFVIILLLLAKYIEGKTSVRSTSIALILIFIFFNGYHYLVSGMLILMSFLALILPFFIYLLHAKSFSQIRLFFKPIYLVLIATISWLLWYFLMCGSIIEPIISIIENLIYLKPEPSHYELIFIPLPTYINYLRLAVNAVISFLILTAGLKAFIILLRERGNFVDSLVVAASLLFFTTSVSEIFGFSTIGIGRFSIILMATVSPYFHKASVTVFSRIFIGKNALIFLFLTLIMGTRMLLSTGALPYVAGSVENSVFLDPTYKYETSITYADIKSANFLNDYYTYIKPVEMDIKAFNVFYYVADLKRFTIYWYPANAEIKSWEKSGLNTSIMYFNSYNFIRNKIQVGVSRFFNSSQYLSHLYKSKSIIYCSRSSVIFY